MSGYITRNALMIDNPTFGAPSQSSMLPTTLANPLAAGPGGWGSQPGVQSGTGGPGLAMPAGVQSATGGVDLAMLTAVGGNPALTPGAPGNDNLMKALAALYGTPGQAQPQAPTPQQQLQQAIDQDTAYRGREGGGLV